MVRVTSERITVEAFVDGRECDRIPELNLTHYQTWLQTWLQAMEPGLSPINAYEISLRLTDDREIQQLNSHYRQQSKPTDVLSFAALETEMPGAEDIYRQQPLPLGDIIISIDTAARQAQQANHTLAKEVAWLTAHGFLHLLGWDHPDDDSLTRMLDQQTHLVSLLA
ncbi:MAG: rRNA maturation RNase YbeY [Cyanobacteria bacterium J06597_16]